MAVSDIAACFDVSLAAISKHLIVLEAASLIFQEKQGRVKWCQLNTDAFGDVFMWLESFGTLALGDLEKIEALLSAQNIDPSG